MGTGLSREFRGHGAKEEEEAPVHAKQAENFYGLELYYGRLLLVYFMRPPHLEEFGAMTPLGP